MIKKLDVTNQKKYIYAGNFDFNNEGKLICLELMSENLKFNLDDVFNNGKSLNILNLEDFKEICSIAKIEATIFPSGNIHYSKGDFSNDELKTCYVSIIDNKYIIIIAFEETQPSLYKAALVGLFEHISPGS